MISFNGIFGLGAYQGIKLGINYHKTPKLLTLATLSTLPVAGCCIQGFFGNLVLTSQNTNAIITDTLSQAMT